MASIAVITGASSGIGEVAAATLAAQGTQVILAVRDQARGDATRRRILAKHPAASLQVAILDLASLASVHAFADRLDVARIDILLNNAGLGMQPTRVVTVDGYERQFATNHLGHFALTGLLMPKLLQATAPRVVTIASIAHRNRRIDFDDLQGAASYNPGKAYGQSKLANLMFAFELDRRARAAGSKLVSVAAHPGVATTGFFSATEMPRYKVAAMGLAIRLFGQDADKGALPGIYAATMPDVQGGQYWGPDGFLEIRGNPRLAKPSAAALDQKTWARLWQVSEQLTHITYPDLA